MTQFLIFYVIGYIVSYYCWILLVKWKLKKDKYYKVTMLDICVVTVWLIIYPLVIFVCLIDNCSLLYQFLDSIEVAKHDDED